MMENILIWCAFAIAGLWFAALVGAGLWLIAAGIKARIDDRRRVYRMIGLVALLCLCQGCAWYNAFPTITIGTTIGPGGAYVGFQSVPNDTGRVRRLTFGFHGGTNHDQ